MKNSKSAMDDLIWLYRQKTVIFMHAIGMAIALLTPIDAISSGTFIASVVDHVLNLIPMGRNFSVRSKMPELVRLQAAAMIFFIPILIAVYLKCPDFKESQNRMLKIIRNSKSKLIFVHLFLIFIPINFLVCVFFAEGTEFAVAPYLSNKFYLGAIGPIFFAMLPAGTVCIFFIVFWVLVKFWRKEKV